MNSAHDVARTRLDNTMLLFDEFVQATIKSPDAATLRGLERRFAERLQIQPSYWSQIKGRSRQIGERLARQFEQLCRKPVGWMDLPQGGKSAATAGAKAGPAPAAPSAAAGGPVPAPSQPLDDDERFIVGLVLTYYRRHPQRARTRLLDLLGEVLTPQADGAMAAPRTATPAAKPTATPKPATRAVAGLPRPPAPLPPSADDLALFARSQTGVAPLKPKR